MEGSSGKIPGLISVKVQTGGLSGSIADLMLDMSFTDEAVLKNYSVNPLHIAAAQRKVRRFVQVRLCLNY